VASWPDAWDILASTAKVGVMQKTAEKLVESQIVRGALTDCQTAIVMVVVYRESKNSAKRQ
jgi:hypothetical protein